MFYLTSNLHPITCYDGPEGEYRYSSILSLTSVWMVNATPWSIYSLLRDSIPIVQKAGLAPGSVWTGAEYLTPTGIPSADRPGRRMFAISTEPSPPVYLTSNFTKYFTTLYIILKGLISHSL